MVSRVQKVLDLRREISTQLDDLINRDYILLGLPYYLNPGDILIWEGERDYLRSRGFRCLNEGRRYRDYGKIREDTLILLQGGGNFGDLYRSVQNERLEIIQRHRKNPIVVLPVSCWYTNADLLRQDAEILAEHPELTLCARDAVSFEFLKQYFSNRILLVPDMAFGVEVGRLKQYMTGDNQGILYLKRTDKELASNGPPLRAKLLAAAEVRDWPDMESPPKCWGRFHRLDRLADEVGERRGLYRLSLKIMQLADWYYHRRCRKQLILHGVRFLSRYRDIYTTRLHGGILSILLDKGVTIIDNSYGKNSNFFKTWLSDTEGVKLWKQ